MRKNVYLGGIFSVPPVMQALEWAFSLFAICKNILSERRGIWELETLSSVSSIEYIYLEEKILLRARQNKHGG